MVDWDDSALIAQKTVIEKRRYALRASKVWHICATCRARIGADVYHVLDTETMNRYHNTAECKPVEK